MIRKIATDSGSDLNEDIMKSDIIGIAPFSMEIDGETFVDTYDLDRKAYLSKVEASSSTPKTAAPSPQYFFDIFKEADEAFAVTISSKLSGSYNSAISAKNMIMDEFKNKAIHIFDSKTATAGETLITLKLQELVKTDLDFNTIIEKMNEFIDNTKTYFFIQNFDNLVKTGRTNQYIAGIAKLLSISIIGSAVDGEIQLEEKVRGQKKAVEKLCKMVTESGVNFSERVLSISHVDSFETAQQLKNIIKQTVNFKDIIIQDTSGLCSNYASKNGIVIAF